MAALLRFDGAVRRDRQIDRWLDTRPADLGVLARDWFTRMRHCGDDVRELMHDGCPTACVADAGFAYVNVFSRHANVGFFRGAYLPDPAGLLQGTGRHMRHVKLRPDARVDEQALAGLLAAAYQDIRARLQEGP